MKFGKEFNYRRKMTKQENKLKGRIERDMCQLLMSYYRIKGITIEDIVLGTVMSGKELIDYTITLKVKGE